VGTASLGSDGSLVTPTSVVAVVSMADQSDHLVTGEDGPRCTESVAEFDYLRLVKASRREEFGVSKHGTGRPIADDPALVQHDDAVCPRGYELEVV